jgi:hypothetical protein
MALRNRAKAYHVKQVAATEQDIREAMVPIIQEQVESIVKGLEYLEKGLKFNPHHDSQGRFAPSSGAEGAGTGGGGSSAGAMLRITRDTPETQADDDE